MRINRRQQGFTLMEVVVATTIFAFVVTALLSLFNYTLKINRKTEALRQATQGMRDFVEFITKEVRNGNIDYGIVNGTTKSAEYPLGPCNSSVGSNTYSAKSNWLGIVTDEGETACVYLANDQGLRTASGASPAIANNTYSCPSAAPLNCSLVFEKSGGVKEIISPKNYRIDSLMFLVRPVCDPYMATCPSWTGGSPDLPRWQPSVTIVIKFTTVLPTGESVPIFYQTTVSSTKSDIPN